MKQDEDWLCFSGIMLALSMTSSLSTKTLNSNCKTKTNIYAAKSIKPTPHKNVKQ
jgi:hypothetical protein